MRIAAVLAVLLSFAGCAGTPPPEARDSRPDVLAAFLELRREWLIEGSGDISPEMASWFLGTIGPLEVRIDGDRATVENGYFAPDRFEFLREDGEWRFVEILPGADLRAEPLPYRLPPARRDREDMNSDPGPRRYVALTEDGRPGRKRDVAEADFPSTVGEFPEDTYVHLCCESAVPWRRAAAVLTRLAAEGQWRVDFETAPDTEGRSSIQRRSLAIYLPREPVTPVGVCLLVSVHGDADHVPDVAGIGALLGEVPEAVLEVPLLVEFSPDLPFRAVVATVDEVYASGCLGMLFVTPGPPTDADREPGVSVTVVPLDADRAARLIAPRQPRERR